MQTAKTKANKQKSLPHIHGVMPRWARKGWVAEGGSEVLNTVNASLPGRKTLTRCAGYPEFHPQKKGSGCEEDQGLWILVMF